MTHRSVFAVGVLHEFINICVYNVGSEPRQGVGMVDGWVHVLIEDALFVNRNIFLPLGSS